MATIEMSPIKRERQRKQEKLLLKKHMREALPILNRNEIRRFRLPYHEALLKDLEELSLTSSADFLRQLIQFQEDLRIEHGPDSVVSSRPRLLESKEQLDLLFDGLKNAESAHYAGDVGRECDELLKLAVHFGLGSDNWWWLGEQLLIQSINASSDFYEDAGKRRAIIKYIYGKFILENLLDADQAKEHLIEAREISMGKSWNAKKQIDQQQDTIFIESCLLLHRALLIEAKEVMQYDPIKAIEICTLARKRAAEACDKNGEANAFMLRGICQMDAGKPHAALQSFIKVLVLHNKANKVEGVCEARIHIAMAYLKIGKFTESLEQLETLLAYAEIHNLPYYMALAYRLLGEYYLNQGLPNLATPLLIKALHIFHELDDMLNREQARNLAAISAGQELMPKYVDLILKCGRKDCKGREALLKLVNWKDSRELFWTQDDKTPSISFGSLEESFLKLSGSKILRQYFGEEYEGLGEGLFSSKWIQQETHGEGIDDNFTYKTNSTSLHEEDISQAEEI